MGLVKHLIGSVISARLPCYNLVERFRRKGTGGLKLQHLVLLNNKFPWWKLLRFFGRRNGKFSITKEIWSNFLVVEIQNDISLDVDRPRLEWMKSIRRSCHTFLYFIGYTLSWFPNHDLEKQICSPNDNLKKRVTFWKFFFQRWFTIDHNSATYWYSNMSFLCVRLCILPHVYSVLYNTSV